MKKELNRNSSVLFLVPSLAILVITYSHLRYSYFQGIEWHTYGRYIFSTDEFGYTGAFVRAITSEFPILEALLFANYALFGVQNFVPLMIVSVLVVLNIVLWTKNLYLITNSWLIAYGSLLFGYLSSVPSQAVTWIIAAIGYQLVFLFLNISLYYLIKIAKQYTLRTLVLLILSLIGICLSRSNSYFIFLIIPFIYYYFKEGQFSRKSIFSLLIVPTIAAILIFVYLPYSAEQYVDKFNAVVFNAVFIPIKSIFQILSIDADIIHSLSAFIIENRFHRLPNLEYQQTIVTEFVTTVASLVLIIAGILFYGNLDSQKKRIVLLFCVLYIFSLSQNFLHENSTNVGYLESRYYFIPAFFLGTLIFIYVASLIDYVKLSSNVVTKLFSLCSISVILGAFFVSNAFAIDAAIKENNKTTVHRKEILRYIQNIQIKTTSGSYILFIQDANVPVGHVRNVTGQMFETGLLYPILVESYDTRKISHQVFSDDTLWATDFEGFVQVDDNKIGIYYTYDVISHHVRNNIINKEHIYCMNFDYEKIKLNMNPKLFHFVTYNDCTHDLRRKIGN